MTSDERGEDIGHNHFIRYVGWHPDRSLNPKYEGMPDVDKAGLIVTHPRPDGTGECVAMIHFDIPVINTLFGEQAVWQVQSWDPLTISPSLLCRRCDDHGHIKNGRWEPA